MVLIARYALVEDAAGFERFYADLRIHVLAVLIVNLAVLAVILMAAFTKRIDFGSQGWVIKIFSWASSISLAAALAWAIAAANLTTAS
ncbi:hypothetical protein J2Z19_004591 [Ensifer adhaerens]|uniref:Uncharacterized protein n=1 Tax=Ensifer adhaerens TaxID=106592 RepID=A0ACC5T131_ENSAD|nr:hypothetical protein [Ensifer adhaerens]MBP1874858.1 hypothetical protein [Ensifer adhaerens]